MTALVAFLLLHWGWTFFLGGCWAYPIIAYRKSQTTSDEEVNMICLLTGALFALAGIITAIMASSPSTPPDKPGGGADLGWYALAMLLTGPLAVACVTFILVAAKRLFLQGKRLYRWLQGKHQQNELEYARSHGAIVARCRAGVARASELLAADAESGASFLAAGEKLMGTLEQMLNLHDSLEKLAREHSVEALQASFDTTRTLFAQAKDNSTFATYRDKISHEYRSLMEMKTRVEGVIVTLTFVCENLAVSAAAVHAKSSIGEMVALHEEIGSLIRELKTDVGSDVLQSVVSGTLERTLMDGLHNDSPAAAPAISRPIRNS